MNNYDFSRDPYQVLFPYRNGTAPTAGTFVPNQNMYPQQPVDPRTYLPYPAPTNQYIPIPSQVGLPSSYATVQQSATSTPNIGVIPTTNKVTPAQGINPVTTGSNGATNGSNTFDKFLTSPYLNADFGAQEYGFMLGQSLSFDPTTVQNDQFRRQAMFGNTMRGIGAAGALALRTAENIFAGMGYHNMQNQALRSSREKQRQAMVGGTMYARHGGEMPRRHMNDDRRHDGRSHYAYGGAYTEPLFAPNAEVEGGEFMLFNNGTVSEVKGASHEQGGVPLNMQPGDKVITDTTKIGANTAKTIQREYGLKVKASDTYSDVIRNYQSRIKLQRTKDEIEKLGTLVEKQSDVWHEQTKVTNNRMLNDKFKGLNEELGSKEQALSLFTQRVYNTQEDEKGNQVAREDSQMFPFIKRNYEFGGEEYTKTNRPTTKMSNFSPYPFVQQNPYSVMDTGTQVRRQADGNVFGDLDDQALQNRLAYYYMYQPRLAPILSIQKGVDGRYTADLSEEAVGNYQRAYNAAMQAQGKYQKDVFKNDPAVVDKFLNETTFTNNTSGSARGIDSKFGVVTAGRDSFADPSVTDDQLAKLEALGIRTGWQAIQSRDKVKDILTPEQLDRYEKATRDGFSDVVLGVRDITAKPATPTSAQPASAQNNGTPPPPNKGESVGDYVDRLMAKATNSGSLQRPIFLPDQTPPTPQGMKPPLKTSTQLSRLSAPEATDEELLKEIFRNQSMTNTTASFLPDSQYRALNAAALASASDAIFKSDAAVRQQNVSSQFAVDQFNAGQWDKEQQANNAELLSYEARVGAAEAKTRADLVNYFNTLSKNRLADFKTRNTMAAIDTMSPQYKFDEFGRIVLDEENARQFYLDFIKAQQLEAAKKAKSAKA